MTGLRDALARLTPDERLYVLQALAVRVPELVEREAAYVIERHWRYPTPPLETR